MTDAKDINFKELQTICKSLNTILEDEDKFKYVGVKKDDVIESFTSTVVKIAEDDADSLPDDVVEYFNTNFGSEEEEEEKGKGKKAKKSKKAKKDKTAKKEPAKKEPAKKETKPKAKKETKAPAKKETKPKAKKEKPEKKKDEFGFTVGTKYSKVATLLSKKPMKMAELKAEFGDTYYNLFKNNEKIFGSKNGYFYVKGKVKVADIPKPEKKEKTKKTKKTNKKK